MIFLDNVVRRSITSADYYWDHMVESAIKYGPRIVLGILMLIVGIWIIRLIMMGFNRLMVRREVDKSIIPFIRSVASISLKMILLVTILSFLGVNTTSFVTALGAAGLAIGLALQGSLSNFAGGVLILLFKPFQVGDFIEVQSHKGTVQEIQILYTRITTPENKRVVIPNGILSNREIINYTSEENRRVEMKINLDFTSDTAKAEKVLREIAQDDKLIINKENIIIGIHDFNNGAVNIDFMFWVRRENFAAALYSVNDEIKTRFDKENILMATLATR
ncbi:MAG: mechanosensitive ion channel [Bacteroidetes bacterium]|nr:mechanosensitive ion channel [Bacteroidota bacterium]